MEYPLNLLKSDYSTLLDLLLNAKNQIIISTPSLSQELAQALIDIKNKTDKLSVNLFVEFSENTFRNGFGDVISFKILRENKINVKDKSEINVCFFIIDDMGYFYFPKSRFHETEGTKFDLFPMTINQMKHILFLFNLLKDEYEQLEIFEKIDTMQLTEISNGINEIDDEKYQDIEDKLSADPPLKPDFARALEVYKSKFQYVELKFTGANLVSTKVKLPNNSLPLKDDKFRNAIEASLKLFEKLNEKEFLSDFIYVKNKLNEIRTEFLIHTTFREKNIIKKENKNEFIKNIEFLKNEISVSKGKIINEIQREINLSRKKIQNNLIDFLTQNPPEKFTNYKDEVFVDSIRNEVSGIISHIKFPDASTLIDEIRMEYSFYDITWEDLNNKDFLKELTDCRLINETDKAHIESLAISAKVEK